MKQTFPTYGVVKRYLIGKVSEEVRHSVESSLADEEAFNEFRYLEDHLVDEYLRGRLSRTDRELFESNYLNFSRRRREKVEFARSLIDKGDEIRRQERGAPSAPIVNHKRRRSLSLQSALATLVVLLLPTVIYLSYLTRNQHRQLQEVKTRLDQAERRQAELEQKQIELKQQAESEQNLHKKSPTVEILESLAAALPHLGIVRRGPIGPLISPVPGEKGDGQTPVTPVSRRAKLLRIKISLPEEHKYASYIAKLELLNGEEVKSFELKSTKGRSAFMTVSAKLLKSGSYVIKLYGVDPMVSDRPIPLDSFFFALEKK